jgi:hypothetical protein
MKMTASRQKKQQRKFLKIWNLQIPALAWKSLENFRNSQGVALLAYSYFLAHINFSPLGCKALINSI